MKKLSSLFTFILILSMFFGMAQTAVASDPVETPIILAPATQFPEGISGNIIVYSNRPEPHENNMDICYYNLDTGVSINITEDRPGYRYWTTPLSFFDPTIKIWSKEEAIRKSAFIELKEGQDKGSRFPITDWSASDHRPAHRPALQRKKDPSLHLSKDSRSQTRCLEELAQRSLCVWQSPDHKSQPRPSSCQPTQLRTRIETLRWLVIYPPRFRRWETPIARSL